MCTGRIFVPEPSAMDWAPDSAKADPNDVNAIAQVGLRHLKDGRKALIEHNADAMREWQNYLDASSVAMPVAA